MASHRSCRNIPRLAFHKDRPLSTACDRRANILFFLTPARFYLRMRGLAGGLGYDDLFISVCRLTSIHNS